MKTLEIDARLDLGSFRLEVDQAFDLDGILAIFGRSGSGKTTLLRLIAGLTRSPGCRISFDRSVWQDERRFLPPFKRRIGYVFQDGRLFAHLNVERNLEYGMRMARRRDDARLRAVVDMLELGPLLERRVQSLSGGESQRVALGRALLNDPQLLLMDEPLSSLDLERKREIVDYIARLPQQFGVPILYVTHDIDEVARLAATTALLQHGRIAAYGPTTEVFGGSDWGPAFGHEDTGSIIHGVVLERGEALALVAVGRQRLKIPRRGAAVGAEVQVRIRARDVVVATQPVAHLSIRNSLECRVVQIRDLDALHAELLLEVEGQSLRALVTREAVADLGLGAGATVFALIKSIAFGATL